MSAIASHITSLTIVYSGADQKKTSKLRVTGFCVGNSPVTGEFPAQRASNADNVSIWWRHHEWLEVFHFFIMGAALSPAAHWNLDIYGSKVYCLQAVIELYTNTGRAIITHGHSIRWLIYIMT